RPVVAANVTRHAADQHHLRQHFDDIARLEASLNFQRQTFARELIFNRQPLQRPTTFIAIMHEVPAPHIVLVLRTTSHNAVGANAQRSLFTLFLRHFEAFLLPEAVNAFAIHVKTFIPQHRMHEAIAASRMTSNQRVHALDDRALVIFHLRAITLRAARLLQHATHPTLGNLIRPHRAANTVDGLPTPPGADQFGRAASLRIRMSSAWSAISRLRRVFSSSSSFRRLASLAFIPPY